MSSIDTLLEQLGNASLDLKAKVADIRALASNRDLSLSQLLSTANVAAQSRLRFAENVEEMIKANGIVVDAIDSYYTVRNADLINFQTVLASTSVEMKELARRLSEVPGMNAAAVTSFRDAIRQIRDNTSDIAEQQPAAIREYIDANRSIINTITSSDDAARAFLEEYRVSKEQIVNDINQQVAAAQNELTTLRNSGRLAAFEASVATAAATTGVAVNFNNLLQGELNAVTDFRRIRDRVMRSLSEDDQAIASQVNKKAESILKATTKGAELQADIRNITAPAGSLLDISPTSAARAVLTRLTDEERIKLNRLENEILSVRKTAAEAELGSIERKVIKEVNESETATLKNIKTLGNLFEVTDKGSQKISDFGIAFANMTVNLAKGDLSLRTLFKSISSLADPMQAFKTFSTSITSILVPIDKVISLSTDLASLDKTSGGLARSFTQLAQSTGTFAGTNAGLNKVAGTSKEFLESVSELNKKIPGFISVFSEDSVRKMTNLSVALKRLGVDAGTVGSIFLQLQAYAGRGTDAIRNQVEEISKFGIAVKIGAGEALKTLEQLTKEFAGFYTDATEATKIFIATSNQANVQVGTLVNVVKKFDEFESAAKMVASLNFALGNFNIDIVQLQRMKPEEKLISFISALKATGKEFTDLNPYMQKFIAQQAGIGDVSEAARLAKLSVSDIYSEMKKGNDAQKSLQDAARAAMSITDRFNKLLVRFQPTILRIIDATEKVLDFLEKLGPKTIVIGLLTASFVSFTTQLLSSIVRVNELTNRLTTLGVVGARTGGILRGVGVGGAVLAGVTALAGAGYFAYNIYKGADQGNPAEFAEDLHVSESGKVTKLPAIKTNTVLTPSGKIISLSKNDTVLATQGSRKNVVDSALSINYDTTSNLMNSNFGMLSNFSYIATSIMDSIGSFVTNMFGNESGGFTEREKSLLSSSSNTAVTTSSSVMERQASNLSKELRDRSYDLRQSQARQQEINNDRLSTLLSDKVTIASSTANKEIVEKMATFMPTIHVEGNFKEVGNNLVLRATKEAARMMLGSPIAPA